MDITMVLTRTQKLSESVLHFAKPGDCYSLDYTAAKANHGTGHVCHAH